jgi:dienelactone hydrolase
MLGLIGRDDDRVTMDDVTAIRRAAPQSEWVVYDATGHDFLDDGHLDYERTTAMDALSRVSDFFEKHLPPVV